MSARDWPAKKGLDATVRFLTESIFGKDRSSWRRRHQGAASRAKRKFDRAPKMVVSPLTGEPVPRLRLGNGPAGPRFHVGKKMLERGERPRIRLHSPLDMTEIVRQRKAARRTRTS